MSLERSTFQAVDDEKSSLEKRISQLTATVENMQKIIDRFIGLYESKKLKTSSQGQRSQGVDANEETEKHNVENEAFRLKLLRQAEIHVREKQQWEQERRELQTELQHYKSLLNKCSTDNSSNQTIPTELEYVQSDWSRYSKYRQEGESFMQKLSTANLSSQTLANEFVYNELKSQSVCIKPYKCHECGKSYRHKFNLRRHQDKCVPNNPEYSCVFCDQEFFLIDDFRNHLQSSHGSSEADKVNKESKIVEKVVDKEFIKVEGSIELHCEPMEVKEEVKVQPEQNIQQAIEVHNEETLQEGILHLSKNQDENPNINLSHSISKLLTPPSLMRIDDKPATNASLSLTIPSLNLIDDPARTKFRNNLMTLLDQHNCDHDDCLVVHFKNSVNHAKDCTLGSNCQLYICRQKHSRSEHLKNCDMKCPECWTYRRFIVNEQYMMTLLEMDCVVKRRESGEGAFLTAVTTYFVNYGLADISEENVDTETQILAEEEEKIENQENSSTSEDDEAAGWELLESELQNLS